ncbi:probable serine/threonine-protein kinase nek3 [Scaptodrosophila lebanonensis]|uniref:TATA box-binding protein-like 1 n=1 Tax=Drosophila lebanonensis TaxID=7225 RepID=A0A6J2UGN1_DROLE|nr:probable serine/threonine-protein kinase nek3 [Scaptodrosophila lebanonensis]
MAEEHSDLPSDFELQQLLKKSLAEYTINNIVTRDGLSSDSENDNDDVDVDALAEAYFQSHSRQQHQTEQRQQPQPQQAQPQLTFTVNDEDIENLNPNFAVRAEDDQNLQPAFTVKANNENSDSDNNNNNNKNNNNAKTATELVVDQDTTNNNNYTQPKDQAQRRVEDLQFKVSGSIVTNATKHQRKNPITINTLHRPQIKGNRGMATLLQQQQEQIQRQITAAAKSEPEVPASSTYVSPSARLLAHITRAEAAQLALKASAPKPPSTILTVSPTIFTKARPGYPNLPPERIQLEEHQLKQLQPYIVVRPPLRTVASNPPVAKPNANASAANSGRVLTFSQYQALIQQQQQLKQLQQQQQQQHHQAGSGNIISTSGLARAGNPPPQSTSLLMQNEMVSIPKGNLNGSLKTTTSQSSAVLANAPRVYLAPSSSFIAAKGLGNTAVGGTAGGTTGGITTVTTPVRHFSQIGKPQTLPPPIQPLGGGGGSGGATAGGGVGGTGATFQLFAAGQRKLLNGDAMMLLNGNKPLIFASHGGIGGIGNDKTTVPNGNKATTLAGVGSNLFMGVSMPAALPRPSTSKSDLYINAASVTNQKQEQQLETVIISEMSGDAPTEEAIKSPTDAATLDPTEATTIKLQEQQEPISLAKGDDEAEPELDIVINNVVCSFSVRCHLKLREIALHGSNVEYRRENGMVTMKLRRPYTTASIWSSGRITCTGATSEAQAKIAARRYARCLGKLGFPVRFQNFRIVNVLGTCSMPWAIKIVNFSERHRENASYEPELHPGVTYKMRTPKATLKIFSTGSITVTAASVNDVESAIQHIYPLVHEFRKQRSAEELLHLRQKQGKLGLAGPSVADIEAALADKAKTAAENDLFVNMTPAHTTLNNNNSNSNNNINNNNNNSLSTCGLTNATIASPQLLEQYKQYRHLEEQTNLERRHIPFNEANGPSTSSGIISGATTTTTGSSSSSSSSSNICANARRRATECWASKLQNKRPRYNDPSSTATANASALANRMSGPGGGSVSGGGGGGGGAGGVAGGGGYGGFNSGGVRGNGGIGIAGNRRRPPVESVLKQSSSRGRNAPNARRRSSSPHGFKVDDLIEEDDDLGCQY